jgi:uncharacterized protein
MPRKRTTLAGKHVLLTGASSGIGRALAHALAREGVVAVLAARRRNLLDDVADRIAADGMPRPSVVEADLAVPGAAEALSAAALEALGGRIDVLVNNAGASVTGALSAIGDGSQARRLFEVNVWAPLALSAALVPTMLAAGGGTIVNVTSTVQTVPLPLLGYYAASKSALAQATRSLRLELAETPVRVVEVVPGATETPLRDLETLPWKSSAPRTLPPVTPESMAAAIVRGLQHGTKRVVYPSYSRLPLELPAIGLLIAELGGRRVDKRKAICPPLTDAG